MTYPFNHVSFLWYICIVLISICAKAKTNMFSWASHVLSLRLKGKWSIRQRHRFHSTPLVLSTLCRYSASPPIWYNLLSYIVCQRGWESRKGLYFTHKYPFLAIHTKEGESISPKQKDRTTTNFKKCSLSICIKEVFQLVSYLL